MARSYESRVQLEASPEVVLEALLQPDFYVARDLAQGAHEVHVERGPSTETSQELRIRTTRPAHGLTGPSTTRTESATTTLRWDLPKREARWTYDGGHGERVEVSGYIRITASGSGTLLLDHLDVSVRVPLLSGKIEDLVVSEMQKGFARYEAVVRSEVAKARTRAD